MKTAITDRTLGYMKYDAEHTSSEALKSYTNAVFGCGADYMEITSVTAAKLDPADFEEKYILRVTSAYDCGFCEASKFAYAVISPAQTGLLDKLPADQQVILEMPADEYSAQAILLYLHRFSLVRRIAAIRLTGLFGDSIAGLVKWCRNNIFLPVDICPLNTMMTGVTDAAAAEEAGARMLTLSFGRGYYFTALEQFIINRCVLSRSVLPKEVIKSLCIASFMFSDIFGAIPTGLARMLEDEPDGTAVYDTDTAVLYRPYRVRNDRRRALPKESMIDRRIKSIGLEHEIENTVIDMLKKVNFSFYKEITKRNLID
ncbi:MAG: hypothetical protein J6N15_08785 [Ruminiclostridium sp.]|nr:hypothetical protein [Ruminiclostridium sp.]